VPLGGDAQDVPLDVQVVLGQVHAVGDGVVALNGIDVDQVDLEKINGRVIKWKADVEGVDGELSKVP